MPQYPSHDDDEQQRRGFMQEWDEDDPWLAGMPKATPPVIGADLEPGDHHDDDES